MTQLTNYGITDMFATVTMPKAEYEKLVRDSEKVKILERLIDTDRYLCLSTVKAVLDMKEVENTVDEDEEDYCDRDNTYVYSYGQERLDE